MSHGLANMRDFRRHAKREASLIRRAERIWPMALGWGVLSLLLGAVGGLVVFIAFDTGDPGVFWAGAAIVAFALFLLGSICVVALANARGWRIRREAAELALAHGWHFELEVDPRHFRGSLFTAGRDGRVETAMHTHEPRMIEVGNYTFSAASGRSLKGIDQIGYVRMVLDNDLPHMYLHAQNRVRPRPYSFTFDRAQRIDLEGDFVRYWRLFVPEGHGPDAYYIFTPDLMQTFVDVIPGCDVEVVGTEMYIYAPGRFDFANADILDAAETIAETVGAHTASRAARFTDLVGEDVPRLSPATAWALRLAPAFVVSAMLIVLAGQSGLFG